MDTLVTDGDFYQNETGCPISIHSIEEACQRVRFCLLTRRGSFAYDRHLGADYDYIFEQENADPRLFVADAIADEENISVGEVTAVRNNNKITLTVEVYFGDECMNTEVTINGNV